MPRQVKTMLILTIGLLLACAAPAFGSVFQDPLGYYDFAVPSGWRYQSVRSDSDLVVFHGPGRYDLLYVERIEPLDLGIDEYLARVIEMYKSPRGVEEFELVEEPFEMQLDQWPARVFVASFRGEFADLVEKRAIIFGDGFAYSIALSASKDDFVRCQENFDQVLSSWRWHSED